MDFDLDEYVKNYFYVSREEMEEIRITCTNECWFETRVMNLHDHREKEIQLGRPSLRPQPLAHIISLTVQPKDNKQQQLALYGTIYAHYFDAYKTPVAHQIYKRDADVPDILGTDRSLTLNGPDYWCHPDDACLPLLRCRVDLDLFDQTNSVFARKSFFLDNNIDDNYEEVKSTVVECQQGSLTFHYIVIPFGVYCRLDVTIPVTKGVEKQEIVNVNGTIVARYADTYGNYSSQECVLIKKQDTEFQQVENRYVKLSRCWVSVPAYSSLIIEVDLSEFGSGRKIGNCTTKLLPQQGWMSGESLFLDDTNIRVSAAWFSPNPFGRNDYKCSSSLPPIPTMNVEGENLEQEIEEIDTDGEDESAAAATADDDDDQFPVGDDESYAADDGEPPIDDGSSDVLLSNLNRCSWCLRSHKHKPRSYPAVEIFSVFIGQEKSKALQIYGSIQVLQTDEELCYIFKTDENEALGLSGNLKFIPIPDGSRVFDVFGSLKMKFDIKDIEGCLAIKGYVDWAASTLDSDLWYEKQLCSLIQGQHGGFAAIHYSIFNEAVRVTIKVLLDLKTGSFDANPKVWGSLVTQYSHYDYSSRYNKDYYRSVLFKSTRDDLVQISNDSTIPLSRSTIIVPSYSSLIVNVDLSFGVSDQKLSCAEIKMIKIGEGFKTVETDECLLRIELDWCEVK